MITKWLQILIKDIKLNIKPNHNRQNLNHVILTHQPIQFKQITNNHILLFHNLLIQQTPTTTLFYVNLINNFIYVKLILNSNYLIFVLIVMGLFVHNAQYMAHIEIMKYKLLEKL